MSASTTTNSPSVQNMINEMNVAIVSLARYGFPVIFIFGVVCNVLNVYVFTKPTLRTNPCCMYFLSSSVTALLFTVFNLPIRTLQLGYSIDLTVDSVVGCQVRTYLVFVWRALTVWFLVFASFDRFLHSSSDGNIRKWSSFRIAIRAIVITSILVHAAYAHVLAYYEIIPTRRTCSVMNSSYVYFLGIWHLVMYGTGPPLLMLIFSLLTIRHVRSRRIMPTAQATSAHHNGSNKEKNLIRMALFQCLLVGSTTIAYAICQFYIIFTTDNVKSSLRVAIENVFINVIGAVSAAGHSVSEQFFETSDDTTSADRPSPSVVTVNVSGNRFQVYPSTLDVNPTTLLGNAKKRQQYWNDENRGVFLW
ncbi:unnamed protein product [Adineta ricciae]|uniref:G-protein coupled receptors family 1 profile domain-containing protein n=1 Tax=Adineta ricciae TaxID=249248 RepID=A0A814J388_ADIRI|nr:unnamed protein product [Adineta ricciae]